MNPQDLIFSLCNGLNAVGALLFGSFVLSRNPNSKLHRLWFMMSLGVAIWGGFHVVFFFPVDRAPEINLFIVRAANGSAVFIPLFYLHFIVTFLGLRTQRAILAVCYLLTLALALSVPGPHFIPRVVPTSVGLSHYPEGGPLFLAFFALYLFESAYAGRLLWKARGAAHGVRKTHITYILSATGLGFLAGGTSFLLSFNIPLHPIGMCFVWLYSLLLTWAVFKHHLFDIQVVIRKSLVYSALITILTIGYFALIYAAETIFQMTLGYQSRWLSLLAFALMAFLFQPLKIMIQQVVDFLIFHAPQEQVVRRMERLEEQVLQTEKFKAVSTLAAGMAHEIKNPLAALKTFAEFIPEKHQDPEFIKKLHETLVSETNRIQVIAKDLLDFAKPKPPKLKPVDLAELIRSTTGLLSSDLLKRRIQWTIDCRHNGAALQADPDQLRQVLINLIQNAADAMPQGGSLTLATQSVNSHIELTVRDTGQGISPALLPKIFDPFVSTKSDGNGLGLAMVYSILRAHRGSIRADSPPGRGTTFTVELPL